VLDLSHNQIEDVGAIALGTNLAMNSSLKELSLAFNRIRSKGAIAMLSALKEAGSLVHLNLEVGF
jgi:Leucine-rich repeat (LRR) protein